MLFLQERRERRERKRERVSDAHGVTVEFGVPFFVSVGGVYFFSLVML